VIVPTPQARDAEFGGHLPHRREPPAAAVDDDEVGWTWRRETERGGGEARSARREGGFAERAARFVVGTEARKPGSNGRNRPKEDVRPMVRDCLPRPRSNPIEPYWGGGDFVLV